jgi:hypothetical protein
MHVLLADISGEEFAIWTLVAVSIFGVALVILKGDSPSVKLEAKERDPFDQEV